MSWTSFVVVVVVVLSDEPEFNVMFPSAACPQCRATGHCWPTVHLLGTVVIFVTRRAVPVTKFAYSM